MMMMVMMVMVMVMVIVMVMPAQCAQVGDAMMGSEIEYLLLTRKDAMKKGNDIIEQVRIIAPFLY